MPEKALRQASGTILAFDFGLQRIGVAVGEQETRTAHPLPGVKAAGVAGRLTAVEKLIREWRPALLVVGRPLGEDGLPHATTLRAERFARQLAGRFGLPVEMVDERYSTAEVESRMRSAYGSLKAASLARGKRLDSHAAAILIEQYFGDAA